LFPCGCRGTLFLDEIGNVPLHLQSKLLTALERHEVVPVAPTSLSPSMCGWCARPTLPRSSWPTRTGSGRICCTGSNTVEILLPPLRERRADIPLLLEHFIALYAQKYNFPAKRLSAAALEALTAHDWPGNVRALRHAVERAVIFSEAWCSSPGTSPSPARARKWRRIPRRMTQALMMWRRARLPAPSRNIRAMSAAPRQALGVTRASLYRRKEKYGL